MNRPSTVLITGVTGFIGKVLLAELLGPRWRDRFDLQRVLLLVRGEDQADAEARFAKIAGAPCFRDLPPGWQHLCEVLRGDITLPNCGLDERALARISSGVTHIIHSAASIRFDLPVDEAHAINTEAPRTLLSIARQARKRPHFVAVSTAYVTPHPGEGVPVEERLVDLPRPLAELCAEAAAGREEVRHVLHHPNSYTFTKCLAEHVVAAERGDLPATIVRPSCVAACMRHPFPGWTDSTAAYHAYILGLGTGQFRAFEADPAARLDVVPCDEVVARILQVALEPEKSPPGGPPRIVHATAGRARATRNDLTAAVTTRHFAARADRFAPDLRFHGTLAHGFEAADRRLRAVPQAVAGLLSKLPGAPKSATKIAKVCRFTAARNSDFRYFLARTFDFRSSLPFDPPGFDNARYVEIVCRGLARHTLKLDEKQLSLGGRKHGLVAAPPPGAAAPNLALRGLAAAVEAGMARLCERVTYDRASFEAAVAAIPADTAVAIVPMHRSYLDFLALPYLFVRHPELGLGAPKIAAAEEFGQIPGLGPLLARAGAFFVRRAQGKEDPQLTQQIREVLADGHPLMFFIEGRRSRTGEFLAPRRGVLRALQATGRRVALLPVAIAYDRVPEADALAREATGGDRPPMTLAGLARWCTAALARGLDLGRIHLRCGAPQLLDRATDVPALARNLMAELQRGLPATRYHLELALRAAGIDGDARWLRDAIVRRGGAVVDSDLSAETAPTDDAARRAMLHFVHWFYGDALAAFPGDLAVRGHVDRQAFAPACLEGHGPADPRLRALLSRFFAARQRAHRWTLAALLAGDAPLTAADLSAAHPGVGAQVFGELLDDLVAAGVARGESGRYSLAAPRLPAGRPAAADLLWKAS